MNSHIRKAWRRRQAAPSFLNCLLKFTKLDNEDGPGSVRIQQPCPHEPACKDPSFHQKNDRALQAVKAQVNKAFPAPGTATHKAVPSAAPRLAVPTAHLHTFSLQENLSGASRTPSADSATPLNPLKFLRCTIKPQLLPTTGFTYTQEWVQESLGKQQFPTNCQEGAEEELISVF